MKISLELRKVDPNQSKEVSAKQWFFILFILIPLIVIVFYFGNKHLDGIYKKEAIQAMQDECELRCAFYGISESSLIGPKMEYNFHTRAKTN